MSLHMRIDEFEHHIDQLIKEYRRGVLITAIQTSSEILFCTAWALHDWPEHKDQIQGILDSVPLEILEGIAVYLRDTPDETGKWHSPPGGNLASISQRLDLELDPSLKLAIKLAEELVRACLSRSVSRGSGDSRFRGSGDTIPISNC